MNYKKIIDDINNSFHYENENGERVGKEIIYNNHGEIKYKKYYWGGKEVSRNIYIKNILKETGNA